MLNILFNLKSFFINNDNNLENKNIFSYNDVFNKISINVLIFLYIILFITKKVFKIKEKDKKNIRKKNIKKKNNK